MKTTLASAFRYRALLLLSLGMTVAACGGKDGEEDDPTPVDASEVRWKVGGTEYVGRDVARVQAHYRPSLAPNATAAQKDVLILADDEQHYQVSVLITNFTGPGTYTFGPSSYSIGGLTEMTGAKNTYTTQWSANNPAGQVVVTDFDADKLSIKGTFSFNGRIRISGGTFGAAQDVSGGSFNLKSMWRY